MRATLFALTAALVSASAIAAPATSVVVITPTTAQYPTTTNTEPQFTVITIDAPCTSSQDNVQTSTIKEVATPSTLSVTTSTASTQTQSASVQTSVIYVSPTETLDLTSASNPTRTTLYATSVSTVSSSPDSTSSVPGQPLNNINVNGAASMNMGMRSAFAVVAIVGAISTLVLV